MNKHTHAHTIPYAEGRKEGRKEGIKETVGEVTSSNFQLAARQQRPKDHGRVVEWMIIWSKLIVDDIWSVNDDIVAA